MSTKSVFKLDGIGAAFSLLLALIVLLPFKHLFGFAPIYLGYQVIYAASLLAYDIFCWRTSDSQWRPKMRALIALNTFFVSLGVTVLLSPKYRPDVFGVLYLLGELSIVIVLIVIQLKTLKEK